MTRPRIEPAWKIEQFRIARQAERSDVSAVAIFTRYALTKFVCALRRKMQNDEQEIRNLVATWMAATKSGDVKAVLELMSDDVVFLVAGQPPMMGKSAFAAAKADLPIIGGCPATKNTTSSDISSRTALTSPLFVAAIQVATKLRISCSSFCIFRLNAQTNFVSAYRVKIATADTSDRSA